MLKRSKNKAIYTFKPSGKLEGFLFALFILSIAFVINVAMVYADFIVNVKTHKINPIAFSGYETSSDITKIPILFAKYGEKANAIYPSPKANIVRDPSPIIKKCSEVLSQNVDKIVKIEMENKAVNKYLTFENKIPALGKDDFLGILANDQEKTIQRDPTTNKVIAEFRSKEFTINKSTSFIIYTTFIYESQKNIVEKIIISAAQLEN